MKAFVEEEVEEVLAAEAVEVVLVLEVAQELEWSSWVLKHGALKLQVVLVLRHKEYRKLFV